MASTSPGHGGGAMVDTTLSTALVPVLDEIGQVAGWLYESGWAEANAGNLSVDVTDALSGIAVGLVPPSPIGGEPRGGRPSALGVDAPAGEYATHLAERWLLVTAAGSRCREIARRPADGLVLLRPEPDGWCCAPLVALLSSRASPAPAVSVARPSCPTPGPTSELVTHLAVHAALRAAGSAHRAVLHTHPTHLVALTHAPELDCCDRLNEVLWSMLPEVKLAVPEGVGLIPYRAPGSAELARVTAEAVTSYRVVLWAMHGCLAVASDLATAFDLVAILEKAAQTYWLCRSAGFEPTGLSDSDRGALGELASRLRQR